jgi:hypothetical protein
MKNHPNGQIQIPDEDFYLWQIYDFKCLMCDSGWAACLHESPPKSLNRRWREFPLDRYPVCDFHHNLLHNTMSWREGKALLDKMRLARFPDYENRINDANK